MQGRRPDPSRRQQARLPPIAPRHDTAISTSGRPSSTTTPGTTTTDLPRARLPPRSRSGCWTCRTRKVKCDEQRPTCGQCNRLGHKCDYNPRLAFKDDTARVVERMQDVSTEGSTVWDPHTPGLEYGANKSSQDLLPPFAALTTDEDRERKAELQEPGTYHVIANPSSFANLPEYCEDNAATSSFLGYGASSAIPSLTVEEGDDPNIVILKTFEDTMRRPERSPHAKSATPMSTTSSVSGIQGVQDSLSQIPQEKPSQLDLASQGGRNSHLLDQYREYIAPLIAPHGREVGIEDLFEVQARGFPPLFHAMMALSALSLTQRNGLHNADALEHYEKVIPSMRATVQSSQDSFSDGALLTHFLLLLYEIAAAGQWESSMWQEHIRQLLRIVMLRRQTQPTEPHAYIVWWICIIDIHALMTNKGTGSFVEALVENNMLPSPGDSLLSVPSPEGQMFLPEESPFLRRLLEVNQSVSLAMWRVGRLARDLRAEAAQRQFADPSLLSDEQLFIMDRQHRIATVQQALQDLYAQWRTSLPPNLCEYDNPDVLPPRVLCYLEHGYMLLRASFIYASTSMYAGQMGDTPPQFNPQLATYCTEILRVASNVVATKRWHLRFIVLPTFMAGLASGDPAEKILAMKILTAVDQNSNGGNVLGIMQLLNAVYEHQQAAANASEISTVDWIEEMRIRGLQLVTLFI